MSPQAVGFTEKEHAPAEMHTQTSARAEMAGVRKQDWKQSVVAFLLTLFFAVAAIAGMNFVVNPTGIYKTHLLPPLVWNGRGEKVTALASERPSPKVLILGSSHVWSVQPATVTRFTGLPAFNAGVSVGMTEDDYALLRYAVEQAHVRPELVLIGLDVESLHNGKPVDSRTQDIAELRPYLPRTGFAERVSRLKPLVTMQTTLLSFHSLGMAARGRTGKPSTRIYTVGAHGDTRLTGIERNLANGTTTRDKELTANFATYGRRWDNFSALSDKRVTYLKRTLDFCAQHHIRVVVFVTPLHPALKAVLEPHGYSTKLQEIEGRVAAMVRASGGTFLDYSDVTSFGATPDGFLDGAHLDEPSGNLWTARILKDAHVIQ